MIGKISGFCLALALACSANAGELITNGGFETGDFTGWNVTTTDPSILFGGWFVTSDPATPLNGFPTNGPADGTFYAVSDTQEPGTRALTQTFVDPVGTTSDLLSFDIFVNDWFGPSGSGGEVDLLAAGADPLTATPLAVLYEPSDTAVTAGNPNPWVAVNLDITADLTPGDSYQIRFLESDASGPINVGVDDVSLIAGSAAPEPGTTVLMVSAGGLLLARRRRA